MSKEVPPMHEDIDRHRHAFLSPLLEELEK